MLLDRRTALQGGLVITAFGTLMLTGCTADDDGSSASSSSSASAGRVVLSAKTWEYDATNDVYYQLGRQYSRTPRATAYENLAIYVPGRYFTGTKNSDGTYTTKISSSGTVGGFTTKTAPIVFPVNTPGYAAQKPPSTYSYADVSTYMKAGFVYVTAGMRGKDSNGSGWYGNAPWGITDLKAAIRWVRYNAAGIPGSTDRMFTFGMSGGGAQSAIAGASGDSSLYTPYLTAIGALTRAADGTILSDAVAGSMCWCPITNLDTASSAYEWNMGQFASSDTRAPGTWTKRYSTDLTTEFASYINRLGLKDDAGTALTLTKSASGQYLAGTYYDHVVAVIQESLNRFLSYTTFPYTTSTTTAFPGGAGGTGAAGGMTGAPNGAPSGAPSGVPSGAPSGGMTGAPGGTPSGGMTGAPDGGSGSNSGTTYKTVEAYFEHLNSASTWAEYDSSTRTAKVLNLEGFVVSQKQATKPVGAFDGVSRGQGENIVLGHGASGAHFAPECRDVLAANQSTYATLSSWQSGYGSPAYSADFAKKDTIGTPAGPRLNMYNPMYYISPTYPGHGSAKVAAHWRIRTGIQQPDTANAVEINLVQALKNAGKAVDFRTVWGLPHVEAEENGVANADANFIAWVKDVLAA